MKKRFITPNMFGKMIEDRGYCAKCGKVFSVFNTKKDDKNRIKSPCCEEIYNNEIICKYHAEGNCFLAKESMSNCGSSCSEYIEAPLIKIEKD